MGEGLDNVEEKKGYLRMRFTGRLSPDKVSGAQKCGPIDGLSFRYCSLTANKAWAWLCLYGLFSPLFPHDMFITIGHRYTYP